MDPLHLTQEGRLFTPFAASQSLLHGSHNGVDISFVENPHRDTIRFVEKLLNPCSPPTPPALTGWRYSVAETVGNPIKSLSTLHQWITNPLQESAPGADRSLESEADSKLDRASEAVADTSMGAPRSLEEKVAELLSDQTIRASIVGAALDCAEHTMSVIQESAPLQFWEAPDSEKQLQHLHNKFFGEATRTPQDLEDTALVNCHLQKGERPFTCEPYLGTPEIACKRVARSAIKRTFDFAQKMEERNSTDKALPFFNSAHVASTVALAAIRAYHDAYRASFRSHFNDYPELKFEPVSGVSFAPPTLETKVIFVESDVDLAARNAAKEASTKIIAGFWESAVAAAETQETL